MRTLEVPEAVFAASTMFRDARKLCARAVYWTVTHAVRPGLLRARSVPTAHAIAGGSDAGERSTMRRRLIRLKLAAGSLPYGDVQWAVGSADPGATCYACGQLISQRGVVMERPSGEKDVLRMHPECFAIWDAESSAGAARYHAVGESSADPRFGPL